MTRSKTIIRSAVLTASDTRHLDNDVSGTILVGLLVSIGAEIVDRRIVKDDLDSIRQTLTEFVIRDDVNLVLTTGGTGFSPRDNTPEATLSVIERQASGIAEAIRRASMERTPMAMLSRGVAGICGNTLIINFPGSPKAVAECFDVIKPILQHAIDQISDSSFH
ncbi:molybdenum cofactor biosynthesis protein B [Leptolyngbya sp. 7M]|uniref:MogA/MoaB family molybdenum cofactor biosynthesis protein n=1 Tax=Leptolyngbya sp. 7M TaxID=2812896 RepID=UPI001B8BA336|nr:MogA/MoaB family molybdenum cofactor biosynthesis protein [Leptolyngbya sp. 7M]QYO66980.1 MogA/MoaB family molybdenum cofactor biosynthesis protein [Leptolyngbya sp. 7M]